MNRKNLHHGGTEARSRQEEESCVVCGCTEMNACEGGCSWVEPGLCSNPICVNFARMFHDLRELVAHRRDPAALRDAQRTVKRVAKMIGVRLGTAVKRVGRRPKRHWKCGMCSNVNPPRNLKNCAKCGAERGYGIGYKIVAAPKEAV